VDGAYFGGYVKPANQKEYRRDRRLSRNQNGKRKVVVVIRERGGNLVPAAFNTESQAASLIRARIAKGTVVHAGIIEMSVSRSRGSIIRRHTASMAHVLTWLRNTFPASDAPRLAPITISPERTYSATRKRVHGGKITAASRMAIRRTPVRRAISCPHIFPQSADFDRAGLPSLVRWTKNRPQRGQAH
jgi:hypothetical protein